MTKEEINKLTNEEQTSLMIAWYVDLKLTIDQLVDYFPWSKEIIFNFLIEQELYRKKCSKCKKDKSLSEFYKTKRLKLGRTSQCKVCHKQGVANYQASSLKSQLYRKIYSENTKEERKEYNKQYNQRKKVQDPDYYKNQYQKHRDHQIEYHRNRRKSDLEYVEYQRQYLEEYNQRDYVIKNRNNKERDRYHTDIHFRLNKIMGNYIRQHISDKNYNSTIDILGYTIEDLIIHLESLFQHNMSWMNYGKWHIDHIKPVSTFEFTSFNDNAFKQCWALSNLQPLWAADNIRKSNN